MSDCLFVYGTLRHGSGHAMAAWLVARADWIGKATVNGELYRISYYPGLVHGQGVVTGDLFRLHGDSLADTWARLDAFEDIQGGADDEYRREPTLVTLDNGLHELAQAYWYQRATADLSRIQGGDWLASS